MFTARTGFNGAAAALFCCVLATAEAWGTPKSVPVPERNPGRAEVTPPPLPTPAPSDPVYWLPDLLKYKVSEADQEALKSVIHDVYGRRFDRARAWLAKIKDDTARKLAQWYYYRHNGNDADPAEIEKFRQANPDWPSQDRLRRNAEEALLSGKAPPKAVKDFFSGTKPLSGAAKAALAGAHLDSGNKQEAERLVREAWRKHDLDSDIEKIILGRFGNLLTSKDHKARVDRMLLLDRKSKIPAALRAAELLDERERKKIDARVAVVRRLKKAEKLLADIPEEAAKDDVGFYFSRIQWLRRHDKEEEAWELLLNAPRDPAQLIVLDEWWIERRINCRKALNTGKPDIAYRIAAGHEPISGEHYNEAEFLAGWIALRFLDNAEAAKAHFFALRTAAQNPDDIATAEYWLGRATDALKQHDLAQAHFEAASRHPLTYYGQLAAQTLMLGETDLPLPEQPKPAKTDFERLKSRDAVQTIALLNAAGLENLAPLFFFQLARTVERPGEVVLLSHLARVMGLPQSSVRLSKIAFSRGLPLAEQAYPTDMLPHYKEINVPVDPALVYSLLRQESEFNPSARSPAGAHGIMQIMPRTARSIARQHNVRYRRADLSRDPSYNMMLGVAHLGDLLNKYDGSYILTLVAYNAGGGRLRDWTEEFGDPRSSDVDAIDWVERIPFTETRNYVKKILTGMQIFRSRLNGPAGALRLVQDMNRGQHNPPAALAPAAAAAN